MKQFVTIFGTDPAVIAQPEPVVVIPPSLQVVDKDGNVVYSVDTAADFAELTGNMEAVNAQKVSAFNATRSTMGAIAAVEGDPEPVAEPPVDPIPDEQQHYQALRYRWQLTVEMHNGQEPDNPWRLQEEQDVPDPTPVDPDAPIPVTFEEVVQRLDALEQKSGIAQQAPVG